LNSASLARGTAVASLATTLLLAAVWLGPGALRGSVLAGFLLAVILTPLALGIVGLLASRIRTGRWLSLALPFYGAACLVAAVGEPAARGLATAAAFSVALAFAATLSWVRRAGPPGSLR
jgi:uncharacterized membrane protein